MKISEMIIKFAGDYIDMGVSITEKQSYLNLACIAWNISLLPKSEQAEAINKYLHLYSEANPTVSDADNVKHDMKILIKNKRKYFRKVREQIVSAQIQEDRKYGKYNIQAATHRLH